MVVFRNKRDPKDRLAVKYPEKNDQIEVIDQAGNLVGVIEHQCKSGMNYLPWMYVHSSKYTLPLASSELESIARVIDYLIEYDAEWRGR